MDSSPDSSPILVDLDLNLKDLDLHLDLHSKDLDLDLNLVGLATMTTVESNFKVINFNFK